MNQHKHLRTISFWTVAILLPIVMLLSILQIYTFNKDFYLREFEKHNVQSVTKIEMQDLGKITEKIISYLKDKDDHLNIQVPIGGKVQEVFGEREKQHMVDVKVLFQNGYLIRNMGLFFLIIAYIFILRYSKREACKSLVLSSALSLSFVLLLFILIQLDFNKYFTHFHEIFFSNDLWLLNPETDVLIQMLPLEFFTNISVAVVGTFLGVMSIIGGFAFYKLKQLKTSSLN